MTPYFSMAIAALTVLATGCADSAHPMGHDEVARTTHALESSVPEDHATIQAAIDAAGSGDVVQIAAGSYEEDLVLKDGVSLRGVGLETVLYGTMEVSGTGAVEVSDLVIDGALADGDVTGITVDGATLTLKGVTVRNTTNGLLVPSFSTEGLAAVVIDGCTFKNNSSAGVRVGIDIELQVWNSVFAFNGQDGLQLATEGGFSTILIAHNLFFANGFALQDGSGIWSLWEGFELANNIITSNNNGVTCSFPFEGQHNLVWGNVINFGGSAQAGVGHVHKDPRFSAAAEGDYTLMFDSPAIDAGVTLTSADGLADHDLRGLQRPLGAGPDLGPFEYPAAPPAITLVITEVLAHGLNGWSNEFVELYNFGAEAVDAAGLVLDDGDATDVLIGYEGGATVIEAGGYAVILDPDYEGIYSIPSEAVLLTVDNSANLGSGLSTNDTVALFDSAGALPVSSFSFPFDPGLGVSVEMDSIEDGDSLGNWVASPCGNSPGASNCAELPPNLSTEVLLAINEVMANPLSETQGEFIELFNFGTEPIELAGLILSDGDSTDVLAGWDGGATVLGSLEFAVILDPDYDGAYDIPADVILLTAATSGTLGNGLSVKDPISILQAGSQIVIDTYTHTLDPGNGISTEKVDAGIGDISSNYVASSCLSGSSPGTWNCATLDGTAPVSGATISIMEVMANPLNEDTDEFIELLNYGSEPVDLAAFRISDGDKEEPLVSFDGGTTVVEPGGYALILDAEYAGTYGVAGDVVLLTTPDTSIGTGLSTNDPIKLRAPKGAAAIDTYFFPFNPGNGVSAEKIDLLVGDVHQNWAASSCNATPGAPNCVAVVGGSEATISTASIVISEVMANAKVEARGEFVELFNAGPVGIDVAGWKLSDGDATDTVIAWNGGGTVIGPGEFAVILDPDYTTNTYYFPAGTVRLTVGTSTLGNGLTTSDTVTLYEADGLTVASTFSFPFNPGNAKSVEKMTLTGGDVQANWVTSTCRKSQGALNDFASPGGMNCSDNHNQGQGTNALGEACPFGAGDCLSGLCAVDLLSGASFCTEDCTSSSCPAGASCELVIDWNYDQVCVPVGGGAIPEVVINEVLYDAEGTDHDVFVELWGAPNTILDGMTLSGVNGSNGSEYKEIYLTGMIGPDGYFVVAHTEASGAISAAADMMTHKVDYQNGPDSIQLRYGGVLVDAVAYGAFGPTEFAAGEGSPTPESGAPGQSIGRHTDGLDTDDNAEDFVTLTSPSPGAANTP
ncbi:MAG: lamin tail domain-containing protein [Myxococcota bacterium]